MFNSSAFAASEAVCFSSRTYFQHPWIWLNEGQHASAVQALAALAATAAACTAAYFAILAFLWERKQVTEAHNQTIFARQQAEGAVSQLALARENADAERRSRNRQAKAQYDSDKREYEAKVYDELQTRMHLEVQHLEPFSGDYIPIVLVNNGQSSGSNVRFVEPDDHSTIIRQTRVLMPGATWSLSLHFRQFTTTGLDCIFIGRYGSVWTLRLRLENRRIIEDEEVVVRMYQEPSFPEFEI